MKIGDLITSKNHGDFMVMEKIPINRVLCRFISTGYETTAQWNNAVRGLVMDRMMPKVYGIGYIGGVEYKSSTSSGNTKAYDAWRGILGRCYDSRIQERHPSYIGCKICKEWHNFQTFAKWFYDNYQEGLDIDKDILGCGKLYSPDTCQFITRQENSEYASAKRYSMSSPCGDIVEIYNMAKFCRENNLSSRKMYRVISGAAGKHKGWTRADSYTLITV